MKEDSISLPGLALVIVVVLLCCIVATGISFCFVRSRLPRRYRYCSSCSTHVGLLPLYADCQVDVQPRPWVEVLDHNVPHNSNHLPILQESGTFLRLGMKSGQARTEPDLAVLEVEQLQTRQMSSPGGPLELDLDPAVRNKIISPTSAEVFARRDTARSKLSRMSSRRTLQFKSPADLAGSPGPGQGRLAVPRQVRRSVSERRERSCRRQEEGGLTSQSEDERGSGASAQTVIRVNRLARKQPDSNTEKLQNQTGAAGPTNFIDNPAYESTSLDDRSTSFLSPPAPAPRITLTNSPVLSSGRKSVITKGRIRL